jgi:phosphoglycerate dehydrogenase-like enzyme
VEVLIATPMIPEDAARIGELDGVELTYLPELLPTRRWNGDTKGEGGVPLDDPRWKPALERAEVVFGIPGNTGQGLMDVVRRAPNLSWVQARNAGGGEQLGQALAIAEPGELDGITVTTSSGVHAGPLAEFAILGMLAFAKDLPQHQRWQRERHWPSGQTPVGELRDKTLLLVGVGAIGTETARLASAFGMHVLAVKRSLGGVVPHVDELHPVSELRTLVGRADAIVVTLPGTDATRGLLDADTLAAVKPGAVLVNVGRGAVIDVFTEEPLPQDSPLWELENVIITPHDIALTENEEPRIVDLFIDNLRRRRDGEPLRNALDPEVLY